MNSINVSTSFASPCSTLCGSTLIREGRVSATQRSCSTNSSVYEVSIAGSADWGFSGENVISLLRNALRTQDRCSRRYKAARDRLTRNEDSHVPPAIAQVPGG